MISASVLPQVREIRPSRLMDEWGSLKVYSEKGWELSVLLLQSISSV